MPYRTFDITGLGTVTIYKRKGSRNIRLTINGDGSVRVTLPLWAPYQAGVTFATLRRSWIIAQKQPLASGKLSNGQRIGKAHHLLFRADLTVREPKSSVRGTTVTITYNARQSPDNPEVQAVATAACIRALRVQASTLLGRRLKQLAALHDLTYQDLSIKRLKTRWGSCDQHKHIVLNLFLVQLPWDCIDYVILHELAHTKVLHHGPLFWKTLEAMLPNARTLKRTMRSYQPVLLIAQQSAAVA